MKRGYIVIDDALANYVQQVGAREPEVLQQLRITTASMHGQQMLLQPEQGQLLAFLVQMQGAKKTLDIGTFTGYSALAVALALPADACVISCERNETVAAVAQQYWQQAGVDHKIQLRLAPALVTLQQLRAAGEDGSFDFIFIDADKRNYPDYYEQSLALLKKNGLLVIDNVLWGGRLVQEDASPQTQAIKQLNARIQADPRVAMVMLPYADGMTLVRKK